MMMMPELRVHT